MNQKENLRNIPAIDRLLRTNPHWLDNHDRDTVTNCLRQVTAQLRVELCAGNSERLVPEQWIVDRMRVLLARHEQTDLRHVINATGIVLHTNMGRAILPQAAITAVTQVACRYSNVELDLADGERGVRYDHVRRLLCDITGAEDAIVVNNNAAAVLVTLSALAHGRQVIVSRGQLVEIGGSFRIPDVMQQSGAQLVEVGATNKTHRFDYEQAINGQTAILMKVHTSNYKIIGFSEQVSLVDLVNIGRTHGVAVIEDLGSGLLIDLSAWGIHEPTVQNSIQQGADLVLFSGDKLMGSAQCGVLAGKHCYIEKIKKHPLIRAMRIDKLTLAALQATLHIYHARDRVVEQIPVLHMITQPYIELQKKAGYLVDQLQEAGVGATVERGTSFVGGGTLPGYTLDSALVVLKNTEQSEQMLQNRLRQGRPALVARIEHGRVVLDVRTIQHDEVEQVVQCCVTASRGEG